MNARGPVSIPISTPDLAGVEWYESDPRCLVRWGRFEGLLVGLEPHPTAKAWLLHCDDQATARRVLERAPIGTVAIGGAKWSGMGGAPCPVIGGGDVPELLELVEGEPVELAGVEKVGEVKDRGGDKLSGAGAATVASMLAARETKGAAEEPLEEPVEVKR